MAHAAPPPWWILEKNFSSPMPVARATATSVLESIVNVTMPSTSAGVSPASSSASSTASAASRSSLRPEFFEKSVAPIPTIAAFPDSSPGIRRPSDGQRAVAITWSPRLLLPTTFTVIRPSSTAVTSPVNVTVS